MLIYSGVQKLFIIVCVFLLLSGCEAIQTSRVKNNNLDAVSGSPVILASASSGANPLLFTSSESAPDFECKPKIKTKIIYKSINIEGKQVVGAVERIIFDNLGVDFEARIDTGATTSSLSAENIQKFERDGKDWVSFVIKDEKGKSITVERQLLRSVLVKRHGEKSLQRPVVKLQISLGKLSMLAEFSLVNRSKFVYPILIGRNVLTDMIIVDVSHEYIATGRNGAAKRDE